jgi:hypothetical protein
MIYEGAGVENIPLVGYKSYQITNHGISYTYYESTCNMPSYSSYNLIQTKTFIAGMNGLFQDIDMVYYLMISINHATKIVR